VNTRELPSRRHGWYGALVGLVAAVIALGPVLVHRGFTLSYDMVFVPRMPVSATTWGMDGSVPRAVPTDLLVALLGHLVPADVLQKVILVGIFVLAGAGIARLPVTTGGAVAAAVAYVWNPWMLERLVIGHWTFLLGLAVLPWATSAAILLRAGARGAAASTALWVVLAGLCGSTSLLLVAATALCVTAWPARGTPGMPAWRRALVVVGPAVAASLVWVLPSLARSGGVPIDPSGVPAFAARPDTPLGTWGSLLTLGGIWNPATWPHERSVLMLALCALGVVLVALLVGLPVLARTVPGLVLAGAAGFVAAAAGSTPWLRTALRAVVLDVPGGGLLRDGQKLLMPTVLLVCVCVGLTVDRLTTARWPRPRTQWAMAGAVLLVGVPVVLLPSLAWGAHGRLGSVPYPAEWTSLQRQVAELPGHGDVASFPFTYYRRFAWNEDRVVLDPMPRLLNRVVVVNDDLPLSTVTVRGEDPRAAAISTALREGVPLVPVLRDQGVSLAVVDLSAPDASRYREALAGLPVLHAGAELLLVDVGPAGPASGRTPAWAGVGWVVLLGSVVGVAGWKVIGRRSARLLPSGNGTDEMGSPA
jgi:hypothetical protein